VCNFREGVERLRKISLYDEVAKRAKVDFILAFSERNKNYGRLQSRKAIQGLSEIEVPNQGSHCNGYGLRVFTSRLQAN
jgi:hypothetical protein